VRIIERRGRSFSLILEGELGSPVEHKNRESTDAPVVVKELLTH
jgi:hypothetical protein